MATEYEGLDTFAIAEKEYEGFPDCGCVSVGAIEDVVRSVLARLQADGRLITGQNITTEKQYGIQIRSEKAPFEWIEDAGAIGKWTQARAERGAEEHRATRPQHDVTVVGRTVAYLPWLPVSDIGDDQGDNDD